ncbi:hypothetical protein QCA50_014500 [Cerrena zonata]|uniref:Uncharacterized protein n=1 Tax=Cerrena zonata TaxID=2478898 RepID=A0AAW0FQB9_9APHY
MTGIPHNIPLETTQAGLSTPANEWANKTTSMLDPDTTNTTSSVNPTTRDLLSNKSDQNTSLPPVQTTLSSSSTATTPGLQFPGAYHRDPAERAGAGNIDFMDTANKVSESFQQAAQSFGSTAASYLPAAAQYFPTSVVETVAGYMPNHQITEPAQASTHDTLHQKSLPSQELAGQVSNERTSGVGALPGSIAESGVARLPDDRGPATTSSVTNTNLLSSVGAGAGIGAAADAFSSITEKAKNALPSSLTGSKDLPTSETPTGPHTSGVGSLPGANTEAGVAVLPDEKFAKSSTGATDPSVGTHRALSGSISKPSNESEHLSRGTAAVGGVGALPGDRNESGVAQLPDERANPAFTSASIGGIGDLKPVTLPSQEPYGNESLKNSRDTGRQGVQEGVGSLVGSKAESGVAKVPDERLQSGVTTPSADRKKDQVSKDGDKEGTRGAVSAEEKAGQHGLPNKGSGYQTDYHPAELHPPTSKSTTSDDPTSKGASEAQTKVPVPDEQNTRIDQTTGKPSKKGHTDKRDEEITPSPTSSHLGGEGKKKVGFMEKMKGEAKMLIGKVEGKHDKVEEGRRMKTGESI